VKLGMLLTITISLQQRQQNRHSSDTLLLLIYNFRPNLNPYLICKAFNTSNPKKKKKKIDKKKIFFFSLQK